MSNAISLADPHFSIYYRPQIVRFERAAFSFLVILSWFNLFLTDSFVLLLYDLEHLCQMKAATCVHAQLDPMIACSGAVFTYSTHWESYIKLSVL